MAQRPVFVAKEAGSLLVSEIPIAFPWHPGMAASQKRKNVEELHRAAESHGLSHLLEISSKSDREIGRRLSAFHQKVHLCDGSIIPLECAFQGSKVFKDGGPFTDLYWKEPRESKRDFRLKESGILIGFDFQGKRFPLEPKSVFYDWLYANAIMPEREWLKRLSKLGGFTDIEFNPSKSFNCQARSCALFVALEKRSLLDDAMASFDSFLRFHKSCAPLEMLDLPAVTARQHLAHLRLA